MQLIDYVVAEGSDGKRAYFYAEHTVLMMTLVGALIGVATGYIIRWQDEWRQRSRRDA